MLHQNNLNIFGGVFVFNPLDDPYHMERIKNNLNSIILAAKKSKKRINLLISMNCSPVETPDGVISGVGTKTKDMIKYICKDAGIKTKEYREEISSACARGYNDLLIYGYNNTDAEKIVIFADDYIMPSFWFDMMSLNFDKNPEASFVMPITSYVSQDNLRVNIENHPNWDVRVAPKGDHKKWNYQTIYGGVEIEHIEEISKKFIYDGVVGYLDPPSFETTMFKRELIEKVGFIHEEYFSCFYDSDYFNMIKSKGLKGVIARNCFIFHYGKGATKALYKETADEKYKNSPVEKLLLKDIEVWNKRNNQNVKPWWGEKK